MTTPGWIDISTPDPTRARRFYAGLFGWTFTPVDDTYSLISAAASAPPTGGMGTAGPQSPYLGLTPYFPVDDVTAALARAVELGGRTLLEPTETPMGCIAAFADPDGNPVGLQSA